MLQHNTIAILLSNFCIASQILGMVSAETNENLISNLTMPNYIRICKYNKICYNRYESYL